MSALLIRTRTGFKFDKDLMEFLRGLAQDNAILRFKGGTLAAFTDNSTGVASASFTALALPGLSNKSAGSAVTKAAFDAAVTAANNALSVIIDSLNDRFAVLNLPTMTFGGTVALADTIPAMTKTFTANGAAANAIDYGTGRAACAVLRNSMATAIRAYNMVRTSVASSPLSDSTGGSPKNSALPSPTSPPFGAPSNEQPDADSALAISNPAATTQGTGTPAGTTSLDPAALDTFFTTLANHVALLAAGCNTLTTALNAGTSSQQVVAID